MDTITISIARYEELIHKAVRLELATEYIENTDFVRERDLRMIIGMAEKGDKQ